MFYVGCSKASQLHRRTPCWVLDIHASVYKHVYQVNISGAVRCNLPLPPASVFREDWVSGNSANNAVQVKENRAVWIAFYNVNYYQHSVKILL